MVYRIVLKTDKGEEYFHPEIYRTKAEVDAAFEIMEENGENVDGIVETF